MKFSITEYQRELLIKFFIDMAKILIAGLIFSNIFVKQFFNLFLTVAGFIFAIGLFVVALILGKYRR